MNAGQFPATSASAVTREGGQGGLVLGRSLSFDIFITHGFVQRVLHLVVPMNIELSFFRHDEPCDGSEMGFAYCKGDCMTKHCCVQAGKTSDWINDCGAYV